MHPIPDDTKPREDRRGSSNRKSISTSRLTQSHLPERFRDNDDAQVDVSAPPRTFGSRDSPLNYMQQSVFSMIAAVGSRSDFQARFDESSESDGESEDHLRRKSVSPKVSPSGRDQETRQPERQSASEERGRRYRRSRPNQKFSGPLPGTNFKPPTGNLSGSQTEPPTREESPRASPPRRPRSATPRAVPVLSRMVEAQARFDTSSDQHEQQIAEDNARKDPEQPSASPLSIRLMEMFSFEKPENVLAEYACSLLQSMLLQGYMYVTEGHVCFYAYLPRKSTVAIKSGYAYKRGRKNPKYNRYWFSLKGDVLSYYPDPSSLYFPRGHIDLRYGISASLVDQKDKQQEAKDFQVSTDQGTYYFRTDSPASAKEWVKALQKVIFRTHNEGESVKVSFPIKNIIDIEESPMVDFAETFKIRVVESGETYAIDEVRLLNRVICHVLTNKSISFRYLIPVSEHSAS